MLDQERCRYDRSWKLTALLLGIVALVAASVVVNLIELAAPWELVVHFAVMAVVLLGGTLWLVPSRRTGHPQTTPFDHTCVCSCLQAGGR